MKNQKAVFCVLFVLVIQASKADNNDKICDVKISEVNLTPEKNFVRSTIAVKALVTKHYAKNQVTELWLLDVYKGQDKLAAGLGLPGTGADAVFHLRDQ